MLRSVLASPTTVAQLKEILYCLLQKERNIELKWLIPKLDLALHSGANDVDKAFAKIIEELNAQSENLRLATAMLSHIRRTKLLSPRDRWVVDTDSRKQLASGIAFYEGNQSVRKDFRKAARYLNDALNAGNSGAYYYLGMLYRCGDGVQRCLKTAIEYFEKGSFKKPEVDGPTIIVLFAW